MYSSEDACLEIAFLLNSLQNVAIALSGQAMLNNAVTGSTTDTNIIFIYRKGKGMKTNTLQQTITRYLSLRSLRLLPIAFACCSTLAMAESETATPLPSEQPSLKVGGVLGLALTFGGDEISRESVDTVFSGTDTETIDAGELIYFYGGFHISREKLQIQTTLGYHVDQINGSNGDTSFTRFPLEVIGFARFEKVRIGAGISHHISPKYERDVDGDPKLSAKFDDATGFVIQADYLFGSFSSGTGTIGIRYTDIEYELKSVGSATAAGANKLDGSNIGISLGYLF